MSERLVVWHRWLPPKQEDPEAYASIAAWQRSVATRVSVAGGAVLGTIGGAVAASFDPGDLVDAIEIALDLLSEAEEGAFDIAIGVAIGEVARIEDASVGAAIERAQLLASRARAGELVLDAATRALAGGEFLFGRQIGGGAGVGKGTTVDRKHPRRDEHAGAIASLAAPPLPPIIDSVRREIDGALASGASRTFVLRGPVGAGASELVSALERTHRPSQVLSIGASPGGVVPLASLRLALARRLGAPSRVQKAFSGVPGAVLAHVASGALVPERVLAEALAELVRGLEGGRPWVVLNPMSLVDGATLGALLSARALGADFVLFGRFPMDLPLPRPLAELGEEVRELTLPPLKTADARVVAEAILGRGTADEVARRVAVLGGDTVLGVMEAARTLIATGELVQGRDGFEWRVAPRHGAHAIGTEELLGERLELLDGDARRVLEAACVVPDGWPADRLGEVAALDGIGEHAYARSLETLSREALVADREHPRPASSLLRWHLLGRIPPGRFTELHRFVADVVRAAGPSSPPLRAELGYYMQEGGLEEEARPHVVYAVEALVEAGYERAARQLSSWLARQGEERDEPLDRSEAFEEGPPSSEHFLGDLLDEASAEDEARAAPARAIPPPRRADATLPGAAVELARDEEDEDDAVTRERPLEPPSEIVPHGEGAVDAELDALLAAPLEAAVDAELDAMLAEEDALPSERTSISPAPLKPFVQDAVRAVRERDFAGLEQAIRRALAEGSDLGAVGRVRAVAELARGDLEAARRRLRESRASGKADPAAQARHHLAEALLELSDGDPIMGIRATLAALAASRRLGDPRGEAASLHVLAACYRALGRDEQAARLANGPG